MARKSIQGITIEIGGDTTKLQTALRGVENKLKDTQTTLKDVGRLLKLDPGNVELLTQKQRILTDSIEATKEKLETLRDAAEQANQELAEGKISQAQYDALQREIVDTEQQLDSLTDQMREFGSVTAQQMAAAGEKVKEVGDKITKVGEGMTKYVTAPIVAVGAASVAAFGEVDDGLDIIVKKTGATGKTLEDLEDRAKNLATSIPTDFQTAGAAVGEVNTRFGLVGEELEVLAGKFIKFAELNDTDVSSSIDSVQAAMAAFGIDADHAGNVLDILNKAAQDTGVDVNRLTGDLTSNAAALQEMGFRINGAAGFLANLNKNGLDSGTVLTGMKKALQNATKDGKSMSTALKDLQKSISGAKSDTEAMQIATELFGSKAAPTMVKAIQEGRISFDELSNAIHDTGNSVDRTFEATLDPIDEFKTALNELKIVGMELVTAAAPMIKSIAEAVRNAIHNLRTWWEGLSPMAQQTIIKIAGIAAAIGPLVIVIGKVTTAVGSIMMRLPTIISIIQTVGTALSGLWAVLAANPVGAAIAAVAALVGILVVLYNKCEWFRDAVNAVWDGIKTTAENVWNGIKDTASNIAETTRGVLEEKWNNIKSAYEEHGGGLQGIAAATLEAIKARFTTGFDIINRLTGGKLDGLKERIESIWNGIVDFFRNAIEKIKGFFNFKWELPKIKLPHFSIQGSFSLNPPSVPHLAVDWYRKAMQDGMILSSPTILPAANGGLRGFGDAGPEAVVGVDSLRGMINSAVSGAMGSGGAPKNITVIMQLNGSEFARTTVPYIDAEVRRVGVRLSDGK